MVGAFRLTLALAALLFVLTAPVAPRAGEASVIPSTPAPSTPRPFVEHEACFGGKYERDNDLRTGNEMTVDEILRFLSDRQSKAGAAGS